MIMDMVNRVLILTLLIGLASAQINFSTSWGKRSSALSSAAGPSFPSLRQQHNLHSRREASQSSSTQQQTLPESLMSGSANVYGGEPSADEQPRTVQLPSACLSLLKSLLLVNQITETEMQRMEKYGRQQLQSQQQQDTTGSMVSASDP